MLFRSAILRREYTKLCQQAREEKQPFFNELFTKIYEGRSDEFTEEERAFVDGYINNNNLFVGSIEAMQDDFMFEEASDYAVWLYMEESDEVIAQYVSENADEIIRKAKEINTIQQLDKERNVVKEYHTKDEIRAAFNVDRIDNILNVIKGRQKSAYGFFWRYKPTNE